MAQINRDIIIVGAGASALMAAWELAMAGKKVLILEARDRIGGRIETIYKDEGLILERGAEFVHGDLEITRDLVKKSGANLIKSSGSMWQVKKGMLQEQDEFIEDFKAIDKKFDEVDGDLSVAAFMRKYMQGPQWEDARFTLKNYVEGYYAADVERASTLALKNELRESSERQYRVDKGYMLLINYLASKCREKNVEIQLNHPVSSIQWKENEVNVRVFDKNYSAAKILITIPIGILSSGAIEFSPALPEKIRMAGLLGFGGVVKTQLHFSENFWKSIKPGGRKMKDLGFIFSEEVIPTWWSHYPEENGLLIGWCGGPQADRISDLPEKDIIKLALESLSGIFALDVNILGSMLVSGVVSNWVKDPYCRGGYSFDVVGGNDLKRKLSEPVASTIYFAGEGLYEGPEIGTVEAALQTGRAAGRRIIVDTST